MTDQARAVADVEPFGYVSQHTTPGMYEWQFSKALGGVYRDTALSITEVVPASALAALQAELTQARDEISTREIELMAQLAESQAEVERLREAAQLALKYGSFEQGSGVIKALQSALQGGKT